jgi:hypothetical protein
MDSGVTKFYEIDNSIIEDYDDIKFKLKEYFIRMGESFKWKLIDSSDTIIEFKTKFDWVWGLQESILINFSNRNIKIKSFDPIGTSPWTDKVGERNVINCDNVIKVIPEIIEKYNSSEFEINRRIERDKKKQDLIEKENIRLQVLKTKQNEILQQLDTDNDGKVDLIDIDSFSKLLNKNQKNIIEVDKIYIQKFVKISLYLKTKKSNIQKIFESIDSTKNETQLNESVNLLKNQIHTYDLLVFHSISMVTSLVESDLITFYEIYECFDQLGVFNSNWENEVSDKLTNIGDGIKELMYSIYEMENRIVQSIENLTYITQDSFSELQGSITKQLSDIDSGIQINNLLTGIQTYQMYRINQNTKRLN